MSEPIIKVTPEEWDAQYKSGAWDYLGDVTAHYGVLCSLIIKHERDGIIDVGCGDCNLRDVVPDYISYVGIDVSGEAVRRARKSKRDVDVECYDALWQYQGMWALKMRRPCAVFCESLYYMPDPLEVLARYFQFCKIIFVSIMVSAKTSDLICSIRDRFTVVDDFQLSNGKGGSWEIMAVKP